MKPTEIEKQIKKKCEKEIDQVVSEFIWAIEKLNSKYGGDTFMSIKPRKERGMNCLEKHDLKYILRRTLQEAFVDDMLRVKTKELMDKLELL